MALIADLCRPHMTQWTLIRYTFVSFCIQYIYPTLHEILSYSGTERDDFRDLVLACTLMSTLSTLS